MEGKDGMTKPTINLQDLRRRIYIKAKAEPAWRFWCKGRSKTAADGVVKVRHPRHTYSM
jgi:hypothetical protein